MPQSDAFWQWAREMRQYEFETPVEQRVYLCIFHLNKSTFATNTELQRMLAGRDANSEVPMQEVLDAVGGIMAEDTSTDTSNSFRPTSPLGASGHRQDRPATMSARNKLRKSTEGEGRKLAIKLKVPKLVKFWSEIGTVDRHWAVEVRQTYYELKRERENGRPLSHFQCRPVASEPERVDRLTARIFAGSTHMTDEVLLELAQGLIKLQEDYELQMDNCQHFAAVFLPRILCEAHFHMKDLPNSSLPFLKHSEFLFQPGLREGRVSRIYHRFLHENFVGKSFVWQDSIYYFALHESDRRTTSCYTIDTNPYRAATRLLKGNWMGRSRTTSESLIERQTTIRWDRFEHNSRLATDQEAKAWFPNASYSNRQPTFNGWMRNWVSDWTAFFEWTPRILNEWIMTDDPEISLIIPFPRSYFRASSVHARSCSLSSRRSASSGDGTADRLQPRRSSLSPHDASESRSFSPARSNHRLSIPWLRPKPSSFSLISSSYSEPESATDVVPNNTAWLQPTDPPAYASAIPRPDAERLEILRRQPQQSESNELPLYSETDSVSVEYADLFFPVPIATDRSEAAVVVLYGTDRSQQSDALPEQYDDDVALAQALQESLDADVQTRARQAEDDTDLARAMHQELLDADLRLRQQEQEDQLLAQAMEQSLVVVAG